MDIILGRYLRSPWAAAIGLVLVVFIVGGIVWYAGTNPVAGRTVEMETVQLPLEQIKQADIVLSPAVGIVTVRETSDPSVLVRGNFDKTESDKVEEISAVQNQTAAYTLRSRGTFSYPLITDKNAATWDIQLTRAIPVSLDVKLGVGEGNLRLTNIQLEHLNVTTAIGKTTIRLPDAGSYDAVIESAIGETILQVPANLPVQINASHGISGFEVRGDWLKNGNILTSPSYAAATDRVEVRINQAIGNLVIQTVP